MKKLVIILTALCMLLALGCGGEKKAAPAQTKEKTKVSMALLRLTSSAPLFIAMDKGFFEEENLQVEPQWFDAAHPIAVATASSQVDVGATGITASLSLLTPNMSILFLLFYTACHILLSIDKSMLRYDKKSIHHILCKTQPQHETWKVQHLLLLPISIAKQDLSVHYKSDAFLFSSFPFNL